jgi:hypothetical protein
VHGSDVLCCNPEQLMQRKHAVKAKEDGEMDEKEVMDDSERL